MYGVFEFISPTSPKAQALAGATFATLADALAALAPITVCADIDQPNDAADVFTTTGLIYAVERLA